MARQGKAVATARKGTTGRIIRVRVSAADAVSAALNYAIDRGIRRHDKYATKSLRADTALLAGEILSSFWLALEDAGVELR